MNPHLTKIPYGVAEFPKAQLADWQKAAGTTTPWQSPEGIAHRGVYTPADAHTAHAGGLPGIPPFLGGPYATMFAQKPWTIRQYAGFSTAEKTNDFYKKALAAGRRRCRRWRRRLCAACRRQRRRVARDQGVDAALRQPRPRAF
jgi:hypothetical protein